MFTQNDVDRITGRWVRFTRAHNGQTHTYLALVTRAWLTGTLWQAVTKADGSISATIFQPNVEMPFTSFHLPPGGCYDVLEGCAPVPITRPYLRRQPQLWTDLRCPSGADCTCLTRADAPWLPRRTE